MLNFLLVIYFHSYTRPQRCQSGQFLLHRLYETVNIKKSKRSVWKKVFMKTWNWWKFPSRFTTRLGTKSDSGDLKLFIVSIELVITFTYINDLCTYFRIMTQKNHNQNLNITCRTCAVGVVDDWLHDSSSGVDEPRYK